MGHHTRVTPSRSGWSKSGRARTLPNGVGGRTKIMRRHHSTRRRGGAVLVIAWRAQSICSYTALVNKSKSERPGVHVSLLNGMITGRRDRRSASRPTSAALAIRCNHRCSVGRPAHSRNAYTTPAPHQYTASPCSSRPPAVLHFPPSPSSPQTTCHTSSSALLRHACEPPRSPWPPLSLPAARRGGLPPASPPWVAGLPGRAPPPPGRPCGRQPSRRRPTGGSSRPPHRP